MWNNFPVQKDIELNEPEQAIVSINEKIDNDICNNISFSFRYVLIVGLTTTHGGKFLTFYFKCYRISDCELFSKSSQQKGYFFRTDSRILILFE